MKVLVAGVGEQGYGNFHTISRICDAIEMVDSNYKCQCLQISRDTNCFAQIQQLEPDVLIGIHLRRCSQFAELPSDLPYLLICGGTDINEEIMHENYLKMMKKNVLGARTIDISKIRYSMNAVRGLIVFSSSMEQQLRKTFAAEIEASKLKVWKIPQKSIHKDDNQVVEIHKNVMLEFLQTCLGMGTTAVVISPPVSQKVEDVYNLIELEANTPYFLVVGRIRRVKDPCFIMHPFHDWASKRENNDHRLVFLGGIDENEGEQSHNFVRERNRYPEFIDHICNLSSPQCHDVVRHAVAVINCSQSEGQALSILEAMAVGTPVIVRDIPGNLDIVEHLETGLVFNDSKTFQTCLSCIVDDSNLRENLSSKGKLFIEEQHGDIRVEGKHYISAIRISLGID